MIALSPGRKCKAGFLFKVSAKCRYRLAGLIRVKPRGFTLPCNAFCTSSICADVVLLGIGVISGFCCASEMLGTMSIRRDSMYLIKSTSNVDFVAQAFWFLPLSFSERGPGGEANHQNAQLKKRSLTHQPRCFRQPKQQIHVLHRLTRCTFHQIINYRGNQ